MLLRRNEDFLELLKMIEEIHFEDVSRSDNTLEVATHIARYIAKKLNMRFLRYCKELCIDDSPFCLEELNYINTLS